MSRVTKVLVLLSLFGCDPDGDGLRNERAWGTDRLNPDTDGDRVLDGEEVERGLDPLNADTDGDGYLDGDELLEGSDPLDADSGIYAGGWPYLYDKESVLDDPGFEGGNQLGATAPRLRGLDQYGDEVDLYDFAFQGRDIFIDVCGVYKFDCYLMADWRANGDFWEENGGGVYTRRTGALEKLNNEEVFWITVLTHGPEYTVEDGQFVGEPAQPVDVVNWANDYPHPLVPVMLDDNQKFWRWASQTQDRSNVPTYVWLTEDLRLKRTDRDSDPFGFYTLNAFADSQN